MELLLVNQEISESRLYRTTNNMRKLTGRDIAELAYLNTLAVYLFLVAKNDTDYAKKTSRYGNYKNFKTTSTDLYMLGYVINNPEGISLSTDEVSYLNRLQFDANKHYRFIKEISSAKGKLQTAAGYLYRLESQLKINNSKLKDFRRSIISWDSLSSSNKKMLVNKMALEMRKLAQGSELVHPLTNMATPTSLVKKAAGAVAGATAGRYIAGKVAKKNPDRAKKIGTGIGAIAGYWAAGRKDL